MYKFDIDFMGSTGIGDWRGYSAPIEETVGVSVHMFCQGANSTNARSEGDSNIPAARRKDSGRFDKLLKASFVTARSSQIDCFDGTGLQGGLQFAHPLNFWQIATARKRIRERR